MKKITIVVVMLFSISAIAQTIPQGNPPATNTSARAAAAWYRGGNNALGTTPAGANIFGTNFNSPIYTRTNNIFRKKLNGNVSYLVNGYAGNRNGFFLLGHSQTYSSSLFNGSNFGAFSLLHLNGDEGTFVQTGGYRNWMRTGITFTDNNDLSYMGIRKGGTGTDKTETVIAWSDNSGTGFPGPDDMAFRFTAGGSGNTTTSTNLSDPSDLDGMHIARFTGSGNMGLGPTFGDPALGTYVRPQSIMHISRDLSKQTWLQITNQNGTNQTQNDGLRLGITNGANASGYLRWQENTPFIVQTDWNGSSGGINAGERIRITTINSPGVPDPANPVNNTTRVAISHRGNQPITQPRSLLHLGYNTGLLFGGPDGWRDWMDVGTFTAQGSDNMYVGLKQEAGFGPLIDRFDAIINWGDNQVPVGPFPVGPDNLRFIFTSTTGIGAGDSFSTSNNGLEVARLEPSVASTMGTNFGMMGIGNFSPGSPNILAGIPVDAKLDIDGDLRIRQVTEDTNLLRVLVIDSNDLNRVHWRDINSFGGLGNICGTGTNLQTSDWEIPLDNHTFLFDGQQTNDRVGIGTTCLPLGKFHVLDNAGAAGPFNSIIETTHSNFISAALRVQNTSTISSSIAGLFVASSADKTHAIVVPSFGGNVGFGTVTPNSSYRLEVFGHSNFNGDIDGVGTMNYISDQQFKTNIDSIDNALNIINSLTPRTYSFDTNNVYGMNFSSAKQYGFVAQEIEPLLPELVSNLTKDPVFDSLGNIVSQGVNHKSLNYNALFAILTKGMQEQQILIDSLMDAIETLSACVNNANICNTQARIDENGNEEGKVIELENLNAIILDQNLPNPFAEKTTINYILPDEVGKAMLMFYDMNGRIIKQVDIEERGEGKLTIYGQNLKNGVYTYSLIADEKLISTKRMVKSK